MTYRELFSELKTELEPVAGEAAGFEASQLMGQFAGVFDRDLPLRGDERVPADAEATLQTLAQRRRQGEPLQYLLGEWDFYGLTLKVGPGVLVPRADTETVVDAALKLLDVSQPVVADLCSGSGAIALALQSQRPDAKVYAVECSKEALPYLRANVEAHTRYNEVEVVEGDVLAGVSLPLLHMVVSNPPYLTSEEMLELSPEVRREPAMALDAGADGLLFYREIVRLYTPCLETGGAMVFEVGYTQADQVLELLRAAGYRETGEKADAAGHRRCVWGVL